MNDIQKQIQEELTGIKKSKAAKYSDKQLAAFEDHGAKLSAAKASWSPEEKAEIQTKQNDSRNKVVKSEEYRKKKSDVSKAIHKDPEYRKKYLEGNKKKYTPDYWEKYYAGIAKRDANEEYTKKRLASSKKKIARPCKTPLGIFETTSEASLAHNMVNETLRNRLNSPNFPDFVFITIEEYTNLKKTK